MKISGKKDHVSRPANEELHISFRANGPLARSGLRFVYSFFPHAVLMNLSEITRTGRLVY